MNTRYVYVILYILGSFIQDSIALEFTNCVLTGNDQFVLLDERKESAQESQRSCQDLGGNLARITNAREFEVALELLTNYASGEEIWIGLFDDGTSDFGSNSGQRFGFFGGFEEESIDFFGVGRRFPWRSSQPNNLNQKCVAWELDAGDTQKKWSDFRCDRENLRGLCRVPCNKPTNVPVITLSPSVEPIRAPIFRPTIPPISEFQNKEDAQSISSEIFLILIGTISVLLSFNMFWILYEKKQIVNLKTQLEEIDFEQDLTMIEV